jgi:histidinol-phosphate aminotransferase
MKSIDIPGLARENVKRLKPYSSARDDFQGTASVFLDANENPFTTDYNRYPDPHQRQLKKVIGELKQITPDNIFLGNGSDEVIDLLLRAFCEPGRDNVIIPQPTYGMYSVSAAINNVNVISPTLAISFDLDSIAILKVITPKTKIIFLCSPNNPSANLLNPGEVEAVAMAFEGLVVIDEAYIDFADSLSWVSRLKEFQNVVVLQTFSKAWGLAGLRLGMCFADPGVITLLDKIKPPYNINTFTQSAALSAILSGNQKKQQWVAEIRKEREELTKRLAKLPVVKKVYPSDANFLLTEMKDAKGIYQALLMMGIVVRDRSNVVLCDNCLRITVGTKEENDQLVQALTKL